MNNRSGEQDRSWSLPSTGRQMLAVAACAALCGSACYWWTSRYTAGEQATARKKRP